ncbi:MAG: sugar phosphate isomerase/epimerase [Verrucomicrobia bacterium]|nr:sugar phosphate isomerase/epimerase [Verrucomicrobiota bacterium]MDA1066082.1 sugar phosphate isomerase/epimerase [Verrucomicrobiota bacterium]
MMHRRTFLKTATLGGAALTSTFRTQASAASPINVPEIGGIQLAIATICMDGFGDENFEPSFHLAPKIGFKNIEFNCWYPRTLTLDGIRSIGRRCKEKGLIPISVQGNGFGDGKAPDVSHKLWCMQAAQMLGCNRVKFTGSKRGTNGGLQAVIGTLKELAPAAEEMGMLICVENHANNNLENVADYDAVFSAIDSPYVGMCLDAGHFDGAAVRIPEVIEKFHSRIVHVDLKDCQTFGTYKTVRFGEGITDLNGMIQKLIEHGYQGYLVVEQAPPIVQETLEEDLRAGYEMFKKYES